jgi:hypothetical protein
MKRDYIAVRMIGPPLRVIEFENDCILQVTGRHLTSGFMYVDTKFSNKR